MAHALTCDLSTSPFLSGWLPEQGNGLPGASKGPKQSRPVRSGEAGGCARARRVHTFQKPREQAKCILSPSRIFTLQRNTLRRRGKKTRFPSQETLPRGPSSARVNALVGLIASVRRSAKRLALVRAPRLIRYCNSERKDLAATQCARSSIVFSVWIVTLHSPRPLSRLDARYRTATVIAFRRIARHDERVQRQCHNRCQRKSHRDDARLV